MGRDTGLLTLKEQCLVLLLEAGEYSVDSAPLVATQRGLAQAIGISPTNIGKPLSTLVGEGLVECSLGRLKGIVRRVHVYRLTPDGCQRAHEAAEMLRAAQHPERASAHTLANSRKPLAAAVEQVRPAGPLSRQRIAADLSGAPPLRPTYGRANEVRVARNALNSRTCRLLVIRGFPGSGKTHFLNLVANEAPESVVWHSLHSWSSLSTTLRHIARFLAAHGLPRLEQFLDNPPLREPWEFIQILKHETLRFPLLLILDDVHKPDNFDQALQLLAAAALESPAFRVAIAGRYVPRSYDPRDVVDGRVTELTLRPLDDQSARALFLGVGGPADAAGVAVKAAAGLPLLLHMAAAGASELQDSPRISTYLEEQVLRKLPARAHEILLLVSMSRAGVDLRANLTSPGDWENVEHLRELALVEVSFDGKSLRTHDMIREAALETAPREKLHRIATQAAEISVAERRWGEAIAILLGVGAPRDAARLASRHVAEILTEGTAGSIVSGFGLAKLRSGLDAENLLAIAQMADVIGDLERAALLYRETMSKCVRHPNPQIRLHAQVSLAHVLLLRGKLAEASGTIGPLVREASAPPGAVTMCATILARSGRYEEAVEMLHEVVRVGVEPPELAAVEQALANIESDLGKPSAAVQHARRAVTMLATSTNFAELIRAKINLGAALVEVGDATSALTEFREASELAGQWGFLRLEATSILNEAEIRALGREGAEGRRLATLALQRFRQSGDAIMIAIATKVLGMCHLAVGAFSEARTALADAETISRIEGFPPYERAMILEQLAHALLRMGRRTEADSAIQESADLLRTTGAKSRAASVESEFELAKRRSRS